MKKNILADYALAAKDLCVDYRDTLFYAGVTIGSIVNTQVDLGMGPDVFLFSAALREMSRTFFHIDWSNIDWSRKDLLPSQRILYSMQAGGSGLLFAVFLKQDISTFLHNSPPWPSLQQTLFTVGMGYASLDRMIRAGGIRAAWHDYRDKLINWPRKNRPRHYHNLLEDKFRKIMRRSGRPPPGPS